MRIIILYLLATLLCFTKIFAQESTNVDNDLSLLFYEVENSNENYSQPEEYWPDCLSPQNLEVEILSHEECIFSWKGEPANFEGTRYQIEYLVSEYGQKTFQKSEMIYIGTECLVSNISTETRIRFKIRTICDGSGDQFSFYGNWEHFLIERGNIFRLEMEKENICNEIKSSALYFLNGTQICWTLPNSIQYYIRNNSSFCNGPAEGCRNERNCQWGCQSIASIDSSFVGWQKSFCQWIPLGIDSLAFEPAIGNIENQFIFCDTSIVVLNPPKIVCDLVSHFSIADVNGQMLLFLDGVDPSLSSHILNQAGITQIALYISYFDESNRENIRIDYLISVEDFVDNQWFLKLPIDPLTYDFEKYPLELGMNYFTNGEEYACQATIELDNTDSSPLENPLCQMQNFLQYEMMDSTSVVLQFNQFTQNQWSTIQQQQQISELSFEISYTAWNACQGSYIKTINLFSNFHPEEWAVILTDLVPGVQEISIQLSYLKANKKKFCLWEIPVENLFDFKGKTKIKSNLSNCDSLENPLTHFCDLMEYLELSWINLGQELLINFSQIDQADFNSVVSSPLFFQLNLHIHYLGPDDINLSLPEQIILIPLNGEPEINSWAKIISNIPKKTESLTIELEASFYTVDGRKSLCGNAVTIPVIKEENPSQICQLLDWIQISNVGNSGIIFSLTNMDNSYLEELNDNFQIESLDFIVQYWDVQSNSSLSQNFEWISDGILNDLSNWSTVIYNYDLQSNITFGLIAKDEEGKILCSSDQNFFPNELVSEEEPNVAIACQLVDFIFSAYDSQELFLFFDGISFQDFVSILSQNEIANCTITVEYKNLNTGFVENISILVVDNGNLVLTDLEWVILVNADPEYPITITIQASNSDGSLNCESNKQITFENHIDPKHTNIGAACALMNLIFGQSQDAQNVRFFVSGLTVAQFNSIIEENDVYNLSLQINFWSSLLDQEVTQVFNFVENGIILNSADWEYELENVDLSVDIQLILHASNQGGFSTCSSTSSTSFEDIISEEDVPLLDELPLLECGSGGVVDEITNYTPLKNLYVGELITTADFPILIKSIQGSNGIFSGEGIVRIPFENKAVSVQFNQIKINELYQVYQGLVVGISDVPANYPDFSLDTLSLGGDICIHPPEPGMNTEGVDPVTGLDAFGFNPETGIHGETGEFYDENGYDIYGNHVDTENEYNLLGCNREGVDITGQPCDPSGVGSPQVSFFIDSVKTTIPSQVNECITNTLVALQDTLTQLSSLCENLRTEMQGLVNTLEYTESYIFGEQNQFLEEGMYKNFEEEPQILQLESSDRIQETKDLEDKHVQLFHCDHGKIKTSSLIEILNGFSEEDLVERIMQLLKEEATTYLVENVFNDPQKFKIWIRKKIAQLLAGEYELEFGEDIGYNGRSPSPKIEKQSNAEFIYQGATLIGSSVIAQTMNTAITADESFLYQLGAREINGVHRAYYTQEISHQRNLVKNWGEEPTTYAELMPVQISKEVGGRELSIYLDELRINPEGALVNAYFVIEDPGSGKRVVFEGHDIEFTASGLSIPSKLSLTTNLEIRINNSAKLIIHANDQTFVRWNCDGFDSMKADLSVEFCREFIKPVDPDTKKVLADPERVRVNLVMEMFDWLDFTTTVNVPPFALNKHEEMVWSVMQATIDMSDQSTPAVTLLPGYESPYKQGSALTPAWKGFNLGELSVCLPNAFKKSGQNISVGVQNVLIDGCGVSGEVYAEALIPIETGNAGGWAYSVNEFSLLVLHNHLSGGSFSGEVNVPIFKENFEYQASIFPGNNYSFNVMPQENMTMDLWLAKAKICKNSSIKLEYANNEFIAVANLNGHLDIVTEDVDLPIDISFPQLKFSGFTVSNKSPYFSAGTWTFETNKNSLLKGFSCGINGLKPFSNADSEAGLNIDLDVILAPVQMINAKGSFQIVGNLETNNGIQKWVYDRIKIGSLYVNASFPGAHIEGGLNPYEKDVKFGEGFRGSLSVNFDFLPTKMTAVGQFGSINDFKYFMVDAIADTNVPIGGGLKFKGFGGGIYHKMVANAEATLKLLGSGTELPALGESLSGVIYTPDISKGIGFKGLAVIATNQENMFNGTVSLDVGFNDEANNGGQGGLAEIALRGTGKFLTAVDFNIPAVFDSLALKKNSNSPGPSINAKLSAYVDLAYNFNQKAFDGLLAVYLNAGVLQGMGTGGRLCQASIHFGKDNWYIWMGKPDPRSERCGAIMDIGILETELSAYLNVGTKIPAFPQIQSLQMKEIAEKVKLNESLRSSGAGIMFGADFNIGINATVAGTGAVVDAGAGFDMMLRKFEEAVCVETGQQIGIEGWYAIGQVWAFLEAQVKIFGIRIFSAGIAAALQARGPNPFYAHALLRIRACALFVCKTFNIDLQLGDDCVLASNDPNDELGIKVISHLDPLNNTVEVPVDTELFAHFTLGLYKVYKIKNLQGQEVTFHANLAYAKLTSRGTELAGIKQFYNGNRSLRYKPQNMLPANDTIIFEVVVDIYKNGEYFQTERDTSIFTTAEGFDHIPESNIRLSYPVNGMYNFYKNEYNQQKGYIYLNSGQPDLLFDYPEGTTNKIRLSRANGETHVFDFEFNPLLTSIEFPLNPELLVNEEVYKLEIVQMVDGEYLPYSEGTGNNTGPVNVLASIGDKLGLNLDDGVNEVSDEPSNQSLDLDSPTERVLYEMFFRVSEFNLFKFKILSIMSGPTTVTGDINPDDHILIYQSSSDVEHFGMEEINGNEKTQPLIKFHTHTNNPWFLNDMYPLIYENYSIVEKYCPVENEFGFDNSTDPMNQFGTVISDGINSDYSIMNINQNAYWHGATIPTFDQNLKYQSELVTYAHYYREWVNVKMCVAYLEEQNQVPGNGFYSPPDDPEGAIPQELIDFLEADFVKLRPGSYKVTANYMLPGRGPSSSVNLYFSFD